MVVGPLPPPMQGAAATTEAFVAHLAATGPLSVCNNAIGPGGRLTGSIVKFVRTMGALAVVAGGARRPGRALYIALDGGLGLAYNLMVVALARALGYRLYLHHHSFAYISTPSLLMALLARAAGRRATHVVLCGAMGAALAARYPATERTFVLSNAGLIPMPPATAGRDHGPRFVIGLLSNLIADKGIDSAIAVLRAGRQRGLDLRLVLAGPAQDGAMERLLAAARAEFGDAIEITGAIGEGAKPAFFAGLDLFVFPSRYDNEAEPRVVIEALVHGVPVLATARGCLPDMIGADAGATVDPGDDFVTAALALVISLQTDPARATHMKAAALARGRALAAAGRGQIENLARRIRGKIEA